MLGGIQKPSAGIDVRSTVRGGQPGFTWDKDKDDGKGDGAGAQPQAQPQVQSQPVAMRPGYRPEGGVAATAATLGGVQSSAVVAGNPEIRPGYRTPDYNAVAIPQGDGNRGLPDGVPTVALTLKDEAEHSGTAVAQQALAAGANAADAKSGAAAAQQPAYVAPDYSALPTAGVIPELRKTRSQDEIYGDLRARFKGATNGELIKWLESRVNDGKPETPEEVQRRRRRERAERAIGGISDMVRALANLWATSEYAPDAYKAEDAMTLRQKQRMERERAERAENEARWLNYATMLDRLRKGDVGADYQLWKDARQDSLQDKADARGDQLYALQLAQGKLGLAGQEIGNKAALLAHNLNEQMAPYQLKSAQQGVEAAEINNNLAKKTGLPVGKSVTRSSGGGGGRRRGGGGYRRSSGGGGGSKKQKVYLGKNGEYEFYKSEWGSSDAKPVVLQAIRNVYHSYTDPGKWFPGQLRRAEGGDVYGAAEALLTSDEFGPELTAEIDKLLNKRYGRK